MSSERPEQMPSNSFKKKREVEKEKKYLDIGKKSHDSMATDSNRNNNHEEFFVRICKGLDTGPSHDASVIPRLLQNNVSEQMNSSFSRTLTARYVRKPNTAQAKPKPDSRSSFKNGTDPLQEQARNNGGRSYVPRTLFSGKDEFCCDDSPDENDGDNNSTTVRRLDTAVDGEVQTAAHSRIEDSTGLGRKTDEKPSVNSRVNPAEMVGKIKSVHDGLGRNYIHSCVRKKFKYFGEWDYDDLPPAVGELGSAKAKSLLKILEKNAAGVDIKLSLFMAACSNDPMNLYPFPNKILEDNDANRHLLYFISEEIPSVNIMPLCLRAQEPDVLRKDMIPVLDWLIRCQDPRLELVRPSEYQSLLGQVSNKPLEKMPSKIFRIKTRRKGGSEESWRQVKNDSETRLAFHNCRVELAYSLLSHGLHNHINSHGSLGPGIYMTDDLTLCMDNCPPRNTWGKSSLGIKIKMAFLVEYVSNHNVIPYSGQGVPFYNEKAIGNAGSDTNFYFTRKPKLVKLRYILVDIVEPSNLPRNPFRYTVWRRKIMRYLGILKISLLIATVIVGASATHRSRNHRWIIDYCQKVTNDLSKWPIWNYVETPYLAVPLTDSVPHTCCNSF